MSFDVFLSHRSTDKPTIRAIGKELTERGLTAWLDEWELVPGRPWQETLEKIISQAKSAAVFVGPEGIGPWEDMEMRACLTEFVDRNLPVIPVLLPSADTKPALPLFLKQFTWVDMRGGIESGMDLLIWGITGVDPPRDGSGNGTTDSADMADESVVRQARVIFPLHGIRTMGKWVRTAADTLAQKDGNHAGGWACRLDGWDYGKFSLIQFLSPWSRNAKVEWFRGQYSREMADRQLAVDEAADQYPSIVAHSFGTYIVGNALLKYKDIRFNKIILVGSILPRLFPWKALVDRGQVQAIRNEYGVDDKWTVCSSWVVLGTGSSGTHGFLDLIFPTADSRFEQEEFLYKHSDYFQRRHIRDNWRPFLEKQLVREETTNPNAALGRVSGDRPRSQAAMVWALMIAFSLTIVSGGVAVYRRLTRDEEQSEGEPVVGIHEDMTERSKVDEEYRAELSKLLAVTDRIEDIEKRLNDLETTPDISGPAEWSVPIRPGMKVRGYAMDGFSTVCCIVERGDEILALLSSHFETGEKILSAEGQVLATVVEKTRSPSTMFSLAKIEQHVSWSNRLPTGNALVIPGPITLTDVVSGKEVQVYGSTKGLGVGRVLSLSASAMLVDGVMTKDLIMVASNPSMPPFALRGDAGAPVFTSMSNGGTAVAQLVGMVVAMNDTGECLVMPVDKLFSRLNVSVAYPQ